MCKHPTPADDDGRSDGDTAAAAAAAVADSSAVDSSRDHDEKAPVVVGAAAGVVVAAGGIKSKPKPKLVPGRSPEGTVIANSLRPSQRRATADDDSSSSSSTAGDGNGEVAPRMKEQKRSRPILIGVRGHWYDVTTFVPHHPGGDVLLEFDGRDATAQFLAYHPPSVLKYRRPVGTYEFDADAPGGEAMQGDWMRLVEEYERRGWMETPTWFLMGRIYILLGCAVGALGGSWLYRNVAVLGMKLVAFVVGFVCLAGFWQQSGFLMHDSMHNLPFHNRRLDQKLGWVVGNVFFGISSKWWRDEHNEHHLFTNTAVHGVGPSDPQMFEDIWIQDHTIIQYFPKVLAERVLLPYQHLYFVPVCVFAGPYAIKVASALLAGLHRRPMEAVGLMLHVAWVSTLVSTFPTWREGLLFYACAQACLGVLTVQLLVSHYSKPWAEKESVLESGSWAKRQVESVVDISCPTWLDWFHGGLHLHSPHHLFPRLSRCYYREAQRDVMEMCMRNGVTLDVMPWFEAVASTVRHLSTVGERAKSHSTSKRMD